jgi:hypothetical protein
MRWGEWVRLKQDSVVELGEELRVVAESRNAPPSCCSPQEASVVAHSRINWGMWRVVLPAESSPALERWAEGIGVVLLEPAWDLSVLSIPHAFDSTGRVPVFGVRETLIAKVNSPTPGAQTGLSLNMSSSRQTITVAASDHCAAFVAFSVAWQGSNHFEISDRMTGWFETDSKPTIADIRRSLGTVPILRVAVGESVAQTWKAPLEIPALAQGEEPLDISILPELEDLRLGLLWEGNDGAGREEGLTSDSTRNRLREFWGKDIEVRISAGALGWVDLRFHPAHRRGVDRSRDRVLRWASLAATSELGSSGAWMLRRASAADPRVLRTAQNGGYSRWMALAVRQLKESKG